MLKTLHVQTWFLLKNQKLSRERWHCSRILIFFAAKLLSHNFHICLQNIRVKFVFQYGTELKQIEKSSQLCKPIFSPVFLHVFLKVRQHTAGGWRCMQQNVAELKKFYCRKHNKNFMKSHARFAKWCKLYAIPIIIQFDVCRVHASTIRYVG